MRTRGLLDRMIDVSTLGETMQIAKAMTGLAVSMLLLLSARPARSAEPLPVVSADRVWQAVDEAPLSAVPTERWIVPRSIGRSGSTPARCAAS